MIVVRFPPSPTGLLHIGTLRTCLYNYLFAKKNNGKIVFRFEDTDKERSKEQYENNIKNGLLNMGLKWDEGIFRQSERGKIYKEKLEELLKNKKAYRCFCTKEDLENERKNQEDQKLPPRYSGKCRNLPDEEIKKNIKDGKKFTIRFKVQEGHDVTFNDQIRGDIKINTNEISDFVIAKDLNTPLYNFVVVIDDNDMKITHVLRGEDHISNTPKQILIYESFGFDIPKFGHFPLILDKNKAKLSKRSNSVSVDDYLNDGFLKEALINFVVLLGWNTSDENEIYSMEELEKIFSLDRIKKGGAIFDIDRLIWMNGYYIRKKSLQELSVLIKPFIKDSVIINGIKKYGDDYFLSCLGQVQERLKKLSEVDSYLRHYFLDENFIPNLALLENKKMKVDVEMVLFSLNFSINILENLDFEKITESELQKIFAEKIKEQGLKNGQILWPLRVAVTGEQFTAGLFEIIKLLGKTRVIFRIKKNLELFNK